MIQSNNSYITANCNTPTDTIEGINANGNVWFRMPTVIIITKDGDNNINTIFWV